MGCGNYNQVKNPDCPGCGAKEGGYMGSTAWGHNITCCSDKCGEKIAKKIDENVSKKVYQKKLEKYYELQGEIEEMRLEGIDCRADPFFSL